jgi:hypothetical protein
MQQAVALVACAALANVSIAAEAQAGYTVKYSGGSLPTVKGGEDLKLFIDQDKIRLNKGKAENVSIPANAITEISYGQEVHRRIGTAAGLAVLSFGIGALVAFSKSKKHYVGIVWDAGEGKKGGVVLQADKNEYRGVIAGLEGVTGKKAVDTDALKEVAAKSGVPQPVLAPASAPVATTPAAPVAATPAAPTPPAQAISAKAETPTVIPVSTTRIAKPSRQTDPVPAMSPAAQRAEPARIIPGTPASAPSVALKPQSTVAVTFASNPPGAAVSCNGTPFGSTPFVILMLPGTYPIKFELKGFSDWDSEITVDPLKPMTLVAQMNSTTGVVLK